MTDEPNQTSQPTPQAGGYRTNYTFSPVTVTDTVGTTYLGLLALLLTIALLRALARNRQLERKLLETHES
jgi:hypothetical protein